MWFQWKWWWWQKAKQALETSIFGTKFQLTPRKTNISPENQWLEDDMSFWNGSLSGDMFIFGGAEFHKKMEQKRNIFLGRFFFLVYPYHICQDYIELFEFWNMNQEGVEELPKWLFFVARNSSRENFWWSKTGGSPKWRGYFRIGVTLYIFVGFTLVVPGLYHNFG